METQPPKTTKRPGVSPEWSNLPRRKCDNCGKNYKPKRPVRSNERGFCADNCRKDYHRHSGAYRHLRDDLEKMVEKRLREWGPIIEKIVRDLVIHAVKDEMNRTSAEGR